MIDICKWDRVKTFEGQYAEVCFPICSREVCLIDEQLKIHEDNFQQRTYKRDSTIAYLVLYHENDILAVKSYIRFYRTSQGKTTGAQKSDEGTRT